jgi:hypothetical protein
VRHLGFCFTDCGTQVLCPAIFEVISLEDKLRDKKALLFSFCLAFSFLVIWRMSYPLL